jgi:hypothetical protein
LIDAGERDVCAGDVEHRIPGHQRRGVTVGSKAEMNEIEDGRDASDIPERQGVAPRASFRADG